MGLLFDSLCAEILAVSIAIIIGIVTYFKWSYTYWEKRNLPYLKPVIPFGTMENPFLREHSIGFWLKGSYDKLKSLGHKHGGLYNFLTPTYMPVHPEYVKNVMQRDFQHFVDRGVYYNEKDDPLSAHLFALGGEKWRNLRTKLTPTFTSGKMKMMFEILVKCSEPMKDLIDEFVKDNKKVDIKEMVARFTTDIIGSAAFGLECDSFKSPDAEFRKNGKRIFDFNALRTLKVLLMISLPDVGRFFKMILIPKDVSDFFMKVVKDTVSYRETNKVVRKDMLQLLIEMKGNETTDKNQKRDGKNLTIEEIAAQAFVFFIAGFETSSTTMTFCLYELAKNQEIQDKVREEINAVLEKHDGKITYEAMTEMKYMGQAIEETLRKYPPVSQLTRKCVKDYKVPDTDVVIEKGTNVFISPLGLHYDPEYFPDPEKFDPDRFSEENKKKITPFSYIPFGEGPRICIGMRFGVMQTKVGLTVLLKNFKFSLNKETRDPLKVDRFNVLFSTTDTIWMDTEKID